VFDPGIIISIQPRADSYFASQECILGFVHDCERIATAFRIEGIENIKAVSAKTNKPIIGLVKTHGDKIITPHTCLAENAFNAGADFVAMELSKRTSIDAIENAMNEGVPVIADVTTLRDALSAQAIGCVAVTTALSGYIDKKAHPFDEPDYFLLAECSTLLNIPVIAEGRYRTEKQVTRAKNLGAHSVCIGNAIHDPYYTARYLDLHFSGKWDHEKGNGFAEF
jgi:N-acylglucosamine-6-phosphate 2-epimerase